MNSAEEDVDGEVVRPVQGDVLAGEEVRGVVRYG
jgi:hypothetical protein